MYQKSIVYVDGRHMNKIVSKVFSKPKILHILFSILTVLLNKKEKPKQDISWY